MSMALTRLYFLNSFHGRASLQTRKIHLAVNFVILPLFAFANAYMPVGFAIQNLCENSGYGVVREFVGHGIGRNMHEDPQVPNYGRKGYGPLLKTGMCIAIEPMITLGSRLIIMERDGWTVRTKDCSYSAHFEHTVAITNKEADVLSTFDYIDEVLRI